MIGWRYRYQIPHTIALAMRGATDEAAAEQLAQRAEKSRSMLDWRFWSDTPAKILKDVQSAKARQLALQNRIFEDEHTECGCRMGSAERRPRS